MFAFGKVILESAIILSNVNFTERSRGLVLFGINSYYRIWRDKSAIKILVMLVVNLKLSFLCSKLSDACVRTAGFPPTISSRGDEKEKKEKKEKTSWNLMSMEISATFLAIRSERYSIRTYFSSVRS